MKSAILVIFGSLVAALALGCVSAKAQIPASSTLAMELFRMLNQEREKAGLPALVWDERLAKAARQHAEEMANRQQLSHDLPGEPGLQQRLAHVALALSGENLAVDSSISGAHNGLMHSLPHRANILNRQYDGVGIGVVHRDGRLWIVQDFAKRISEMQDTQAENVIAEAAASVKRSLHQVRDTRVRRLACRMAQADRLDSLQALQLPSAHHVAAYTSLNPRELPGNARRLLSFSDASQVAIGACFARTSQYPSGVYWVLLVLYGGS